MLTSSHPEQLLVTKREKRLLHIGRISCPFKLLWFLVFGVGVVHREDNCLWLVRDFCNFGGEDLLNSFSFHIFCLFNFLKLFEQFFYTWDSLIFLAVSLAHFLLFAQLFGLNFWAFFTFYLLGLGALVGHFLLFVFFLHFCVTLCRIFVGGFLCLDFWGNNIFFFLELFLHRTVAFALSVHSRFRPRRLARKRL